MTDAAAHLAHFDALYADDPDPWDYEADPLERRKRAVVLAALGSGPLGLGAELGCGPGVATAEMAPRFARLLAIDGAVGAATLARERTAGHPNVTVRRAPLPPALRPRSVDAIIATEVLYYLPPAILDRTLTTCRAALRPGGRFVSTNSLTRFDDAEVSNAALSRRQRAVFGPPLRTVVGAGWRCDVFGARRGLGPGPASRSRTAPRASPGSATRRSQVVSPLGFEPRTY